MSLATTAGWTVEPIEGGYIRLWCAPSAGAPGVVWLTPAEAYALSVELRNHALAAQATVV